MTVSRRQVLSGMAASALLLARPALAATSGEDSRALRLYNVHTDESFRDVYYADGGYLPDALGRLDVFMRDHHADAVGLMDPGVHDILWRLQNRYLQVYGREVTINVHSAFRTRETNEMLRPEGAAQNSFHMRAKAVDVSVQGLGIYFLADQAPRVGAGGCGIYMRSQFAHLDTGPRRSWTQPLW